MNYKLVLLLLISIFSSRTILSHPIEWAKNMGGSADDAVSAMALDASGNVVTSGYFTGTADFDPDSISDYTLVAAGNTDMFVSKIDAAGHFLWAKALGGTSDEIAKALVLDDSGNVYVTGWFNGTVDFDPGPSVYNLTCLGSHEFVVKLDVSGNLVWAKAFVGTGGSAASTSITLDDSGNVYTTGYFTGTVDFNPDTGTYNLTCAGNQNIFLSKLSNSGNFLWAKSFTGSGYNYSQAIALDRTSGAIYLTGSFQGSMDFNPHPTSGYFLSAAGFDDLFLLKLDSSASFVWAKRTGVASHNAFGRSLAVDDSGYIYTTGYFNGTIDFDPNAGVVNLGSISEEIFISKMSGAGNLIWAKQMGGSGSDWGLAICLDTAANVYTTGRFIGTADFAPGAGQYLLSTPGTAWDAFISKLDSAGNFLWAKSAGGNNSDDGQAIAVGSGSQVCLAGNFRSPGMDTDSILLANHDTINNTRDVFILKTGCIQSSVLYPVACISYTSPSGKYTWNTSGTYFDDFISSTGCDSIIRIDLTIIQNYTFTTPVTACDSFTSPSGNHTWTVSGSYADTIFTPGWCDTIYLIPLTINQADTAVTQAGNVLTAVSAGGPYQWIDCNTGFPVPGATQQNFTPTANGNYAVIVQENGCTDTSACYSITSVGLNELNTAGISISPNPVNTVFYIEHEIPLSKIELQNITGQKIIEWICSPVSTLEKLDISLFPPGMYFLSVTDTRGRSAFKILKQ